MNYERIVASVGNRQVVTLSLMFLVAAATALGNQAAVALPWDSVLTILSGSIQGPVATGVAVIGITIAGASLIFTHDMGMFGKTAAVMTLAACFVQLGVKTLTALGIAGAVI